jgi:protein BCP1
LIFLSRVYHLSEEEESMLANSASSRSSEANSSTKKRKKHRPPEGDQVGGARPADGIYPFHAEDDIILKVHTLSSLNEFNA